MKILMETEKERDAFLEKCDSRDCVDCILYNECGRELFVLERYYKLMKAAEKIPIMLIQKGDGKVDDA